MSNSTGIRRQPRPKLTVVNPRAAGIDIGSRFHVVAIPCELEDQSTRQFGTFTGDLLELATCLKEPLGNERSRRAPGLDLCLMIILNADQA
jgi:hypothetical protein